MYNNGYEFWNDLVEQFGKVEAVKVANKYLDMQIHIVRENPDEYEFCKELYTAMKIEGVIK